MIRKYFAVLFILLGFSTVARAAPLEQYASTVINFSSEWNPSYWAAEDALGAPNTFSYGDISTSWAPIPANGTLEYLTLGYDTPVYADGVTVRETWGNGFVYQVDVVDLGDGYHTVWTGTDPSPEGSPVDFRVSWDRTSYLVRGVKIYVDTNCRLNAWEEIDSVTLHGNDTPPNGLVALAGGPYWAGTYAPYQTVDLDGAASYHVDAGRTLDLYEWDIGGDGTFEVSSSGPTASTIAPPDPGTYRVVLRVTDDLNIQQEDFGLLRVLGEPTATINLPHDNGYPIYYGEPITFSGSTAVGIDAYRWELDGQLLSEEATFTTSALSVGTHEVVYWVRDVRGRWSAPATRNVTVLSQAARVDLALEWGDISFRIGDEEVTNPGTLTPVTIRLVVHNLSTEGTAPAGYVQLWDTYENAGTTYLGYVGTPAIEPGGTATVEYEWAPTLEQPGYHLIQATIQTSVGETFGANNTAVRFLVRGTNPASGNMTMDVVSLNLPTGGQYYVGTQLRLQGYVQYHWQSGYTLPVLGGLVTIRIGEQTWTTRTLDTGWFNADIALPTEPGGYNLTVEAADATLTGFAAVSFFTIPYAGPDLAATAVRTDFGVQGVSDTIYARVMNLGGVPLPPASFRTRIEVIGPSGETVYTEETDTVLTTDLPSYQGVDVAFPNFTPSAAGTYRATVTVDILGSVVESNEANNVYQNSLYVYPAFVDLQPIWIGRSCGTVSAQVVNNGGSPSSAGTVTFSDGLGWSAPVPLPALGAKGQSATVSASYGGSGTATAITATVSSPDYDGVPANNTLTVSFDFSGQVDLSLADLRVNDRSWWDTNVVYISYPNSLHALVRNQGCLATAGTVEFLVNGSVVGSVPIGALVPGESAEVILNLDFAGFTAATNHLLGARVTASQGTDGNRANDTRNEGLIVAPQPPDYQLFPEDITFSIDPRHPARNEKFFITARIHNVGLAPGREFQVAFYEEGRIPIGVVQTIHLAEGIPVGGFYDAVPRDINGITVDWGYGFSGNHAIVVTVAPLAGIQDDPNDTNNFATRKVWINHPPTAKLALVSQTDGDRRGDTVTVSATGSNDDLDTGVSDKGIARYDWRVDGVLAGSTGPDQVTFTKRFDVPGHHTISVTAVDTSNETATQSVFADVLPRVVSSAGSGGTTNPGGETYVELGARLDVAITPNLNYRVETVTVDGGLLPGPVTSFSFETITADHTIHATFAAITQVTLIDPDGGEVLEIGSVFPVRWAAPATAVKFDLYYSTNNGASYVRFARQVTGYSYNWTVPTLAANAYQCFVKVVGLNSTAKVTIGTDVSNAPFTIQARPPDTQAPTVPTGLVAQAASASRVNLSWQASSDNIGVAGYTIYRNGAAIGTSTGTAYADTTTAANTTYRYAIDAYDADGNRSARSAEVPATTPAAPFLRIAAIAFSTTTAKTTESLTMKIKITDSQGVALSGAAIAGTLTPPAPTASKTYNGTTGSTGEVSFVYSVRNKLLTPGPHLFCVTGLSLGGYARDPAQTLPFCATHNEPN